MAKSSHFVALVAAAGVLAAAGLLVLIGLIVQERSVEATSPGKPGKIAYSAYDGNDSEIYTIDLGGGNALKVTDNDSNDFQPDYAPNGQTIAYVGYPPSSQEYDGTNEAIYTIDVRGGGNSSKVVDNASEPSYSPSGKKIAYLGDTPANPAIYTIGVGGGGKVKVTDTGAADSEPSWGSQ
jgi:Tol biopolymer transport system component